MVEISRKNRIFAGTLVAIFMVASTPVHATGGLFCTATDGSGASLSYNSGRLPILAILSAQVSAEGQDWTTDGSAGTQISVGQAFQDSEKILVDFVDTNIEEILVSLRVFSGGTSKSFAEGGVLIIKDMGAYPVKCESE